MENSTFINTHEITIYLRDGGCVEGQAYTSGTEMGMFHFTGVVGGKCQNSMVPIDMISLIEKRPLT